MSSPLLSKEGQAATIKRMQRYLKIVAAGVVQSNSNHPRCAAVFGSETTVDAAQQPLLRKEGIKSHLKRHRICEQQY